MKNIVLGQIYYLDLGSLISVAVKPINFTEKGVICEYLNSWQGRTEELDYELFSINGLSYEKL
jgi:hypothetical protein